MIEMIMELHLVIKETWEWICRFFTDNGTAIASIGTIITSWILIHQFRQERSENKRRQASLVSCWLDETDNQIMKECIIVSNDSELPIYEVCVSCDDLNVSNIDKVADCVGTKDQCAYVPVIPPGRYKILTEYQGRGMCHLFNSSITFKDTYGNYWTRNAIGSLVCHKDSTTKIRKLDLPVIPHSYEKID